MKVYSRCALYTIGNKTFSVERDLLERFPETQLAQRASRATAPISSLMPRNLPECDANHFPYVLDYMRHGKVVLPSNAAVTKETLLKTFKILEFDNTNDILSTAIQVSPFPLSVVDSVQYL